MASPSPDAAASMGDEQQAALKRKRNLPGTPDPQAEVIALSPKTLMATNRFLCEVCGKGFQRDQNLQLHRRGHNLPWKLKQREGQEIKKRVYVCPEVTCVHHDPSRALGDLTGIKKHFSRKHGEKKWKCEKCSKRYAVHSDWKAHQKVCGTREYRCDCGTLFSRRDSFVTHRAFCDALAAESARASSHGGDETQQSGGVENNAVGSAGAEHIDAPVSPFSRPTSGEPHSEVLEPLLRDGCRADIPLTESRISSLPSGSVQGRIAVASQASSKGPGLSLCLGTGLGPGPPGASDNIGCLPQSEGKADSKQINNFFPVDSERAERTHWPLPLASTGIFSSMLATPNTDLESQGYATGRYSSTGMAGLSIGMNSLTSNATNSQFSSSTSYLENAFISATRHRQHTGSQLPATTLLQKAAMMGSTTSSSFLFRNFGLNRDSRALSPEESGQHDLWAGITSSQSSAWQSSSSVRPAVAELRLDCGRGYETPDAGEFRDCGAARPQSTFYVASSSSAEHLLRAGMDRYQRAGHGQTEHEGAMGPMCTELEGAQRSERYEGNRMTLDFLGVGGQSRSMGLSSERRDVANKDLSMAQANLEPLAYRQDSAQARTGGLSSSSESRLSLQ